MVLILLCCFLLVLDAFSFLQPLVRFFHFFVWQPIRFNVGRLIFYFFPNGFINFTNSNNTYDLTLPMAIAMSTHLEQIDEQQQPVIVIFNDIGTQTEIENRCNIAIQTVNEDIVTRNNPRQSARINQKKR